MEPVAKKITEYVLAGFTPEQLKRIREEAKHQKVSVSALIRFAVDRFVLTKRAERAASDK
jgi:hypothetical protein